MASSNGDVSKTKQVPTQCAVIDEDPEATLVVPPDGGWGWVIVAASFFCNVIVDGIVFSAGMFHDEIRETFNVSKAQVALVSSLLSGFYLLAGPFVSGLANKWGFRVVTIIGSFIASMGFALSYFANSVEYLYMTYGVIGGIGFCMIYMPSVITVGFYFERWRALATGISLCGSGVGTFLFAPLSSLLIEKAGWRGALLVQAGVILNCAIFGALFRPVQPIIVSLLDKDKTDEESTRKSGPDGKPLMIKFDKDAMRQAYSVPNSTHNTWMGANNNTKYPTAAEVFRGSLANLDRRPSGNLTGTSIGMGYVTTKLEQLTKAQKRLSGSLNSEEVRETTLSNAKELKPVGEEEDESIGPLLENENNQPIALSARRHTVSGRRPQDVSREGQMHNRSRRGTLTNETSSRPFYRDDIFFSASLARLPQYTSNTSIGYHMTVTRVPTEQDVAEEKSCIICPEAVRRTLATMLDITLLKSPSFMLLAASGFFTMMGFFIPFMYLTPRAKIGGLDENSTLWLVSTIGIANTIGRVLCGILTSMKGVNALWINNVAITFGGIATIISGFSMSKTYQFSYCAIFGIAIACFASLRSIIVVELMGLEKLTNAFGLLMLFQGLAAAIGTPIAGIFMDITGSYDASFYLAGSLITLSAILCYPIRIVNNWETRRAASTSVVE